MVQSFFGIPDLLTAERFKCFYDKAQYFRAVDRAGAEHEVRVREEADLLALARRLSPHEALKVFEELQPLYEGFFEPEDGQTPRRVLRDGICGLLRPVVDAQLCEFLAGENVVRRLREPKRFDVFKALLFGRRFLPWPPSVRSALFQLSASAEAEDSKNDEAELLFELLIDVIGYKDQLFDFQGAQQVLKDTEFVGRLWDTVSSRDLLPQGELYLLAVRAKFLQLGTSPDAMPLDDGLARQLSERSSEIDQIAGKL
jgi:hypothetical protein